VHHLDLPQSRRKREDGMQELVPHHEHHSDACGMIMVDMKERDGLS
jgi:hypothetical protein